MDINRIRYFRSLVKTGSVTKAAQLHHISAPAMSKAIRVFEGEINETLLVPHGRGVLLTDRAKQLAPIFEEILRKLDSLIDKKDLAETFSEGNKPLKVATFEVFSTYFMETLIEKSFPGRPTLIHEMSPGKMEEAVSNGVVDYAMTYLPIPHPELDFLRVQNIEMGIFGLKNKFSEFSEKTTPFVIPVTPVEGSPNKVRGLDGWPDEAFPRHVLYRVSLLQTALGLCRRGLAVIYMPRFLAALYNETVKPEFTLYEKAKPKDFPSRKDYVYLVKRKTDAEGVIAKKLGAALRKHCGHFQSV